MKSTRCQARPAATTSDKADVEYEQYWKKEIGYSYGDRGANEPPLELLGEKLVDYASASNERRVWKDMKIYPDK